MDPGEASRLGADLVELRDAVLPVTTSCISDWVLMGSSAACSNERIIQDASIVQPKPLGPPPRDILLILFR